MRRRAFIAALGTAAAWPMVARGQQPAIPVIGFVGIGSAENSEYLVAAFRKGLSEAGYVEGVNVATEFRWANGRDELVLKLAEELVKLKVNVIVGSGTVLITKSTALSRLSRILPTIRSKTASSPASIAPAVILRVWTCAPIRCDETVRAVA